VLEDTVIVQWTAERTGLGDLGTIEGMMRLAEQRAGSGEQRGDERQPAAISEHGGSDGIPNSDIR